MDIAYMYNSLMDGLNTFIYSAFSRRVLYTFLWILIDLLRLKNDQRRESWPVAI